MTEFDDIWKKILEKLKEKIDEPSFSAFFGDSFVYSVAQNKVYIATQTNLAALIFNSKYKQLIEEACHDVTQTNYELHFDKLENYEKDKKIVKNEGKLFFKDSKLNPRFTFDTFVIGPSNKEALQASLIVASNPGTMYNPLFIYSDSGLGKTHLLHAIGNFIKSNKTYKNVLISSTSSFIDEYIKGARGEKDLNSLKDYIKDFDVLLIDDIQGLVDHKKTESYFFDLFNYFVDNEKQIVLTCDKLPSELKGIEQRLVTRFSQGLLSKINPPSLETSIEILKSKLIQNGIDLNSIDYDALQFIAEKKSGSVRELEGALNKLLSYTINFKLENDVLSTQIYLDEQEQRNTLIKLLLTIPLLDCVGQLKGYPDGAMLTAINNDEAQYYTLENEGVEIKNTQNNKDIIVRIDLNSEFNFLK